MSEQRPQQARGRDQSDGATDAARPADWYLSDTYAEDPFAAGAYDTEAGADPYGLRAAEAAAAPPKPPATPLPPQSGPPEPALTPPPTHWTSLAADLAELRADLQPTAPAPAPAAPAPATPAGPEAEAAEADAEPVVPELTMELRVPEAPAQPVEPVEPAEPLEPVAGPVESSPWNTETTEYVGVDALLGARAAAEEPEQHPEQGPGHPTPPPQPATPPIEFDPPLSEEEANLQVAAVQVPPAHLVPEETPAAGDEGRGGGGGGGGKVSGLLGSSAVMAAGTLVSRGTGFLRTMVIAAAIGVGTMGDSYNAANTLPTLLYILIGGGALNAVFVPQLVRSMKQDEDGGTAYANRLLTLVMTGLAGVAFVAVLAAPVLVQLISHSLMKDQASADATVALARYCLPTIFFMGVHVVMGQILNARGRFGAMMWTPVLNNIVVIFTFAMYLGVFGTFEHSEVTPDTVSPEGIRLLGVGTLLGLAVQALAMVPYLRAAGFHFKPRFDWRGHGLGKAARLAKWTFLFVLANQAGYLVVTQLATAAGSKAEKAGHLGVGLAAYSNALLIWQLPMAVVTVSVMSAVLPRLSRSAADGDPGAVRDDLSYGLRTSAVAIVPAAFLFLALGPVIGSAIYGLGNGGAVAHGTTAVGFMLSAFALGLIPYSVQYVLLRGFYAYEDTRTPFSNTVWVAVCQAAAAVLCYLVLPAQWAVTGMALGYGAAYAVGVAVAVPKLKAKIGGLDTGRIAKTYVRLTIASLPAAAVGLGVELALNGLLDGWLGSVLTLVLAAGLQLAVFGLVARRMRIEELNSLLGMVRSRLGR
ncbi:membrane protein [Kitasatospora sp. MMS16-BH015]|uniref:murein biosynthesis integral membrane protein MurJ n=1 Tax=Kitasatospora sp. MMS16-BH015 TaxID=2018025 RepID=UPI000CA26AB1|nr:murein biosynthesis integral membrane protein MurJ [Kitasatospora sp. MMS16-BH015]AUG78548.1 membrane protein [Kitasatospora sp. MMS16-BH015]